MRKGSLPRPIDKALSWSFGYDYAPDGLDEAAIDALIEQAYGQGDTSSDRPTWLSSDVTATRSERRRVRQVVRALPSELMSRPHAVDRDDEVAA